MEQLCSKMLLNLWYTLLRYTHCKFFPTRESLVSEHPGWGGGGGGTGKSLTFLYSTAYFGNSLHSILYTFSGAGALPWRAQTGGSVSGWPTWSGWPPGCPGSPPSGYSPWTGPPSWQCSAPFSHTSSYSSRLNNIKYVELISKMTPLVFYNDVSNIWLIGPFCT
jgi:hypothetical protein